MAVIHAFRGLQRYELLEKSGILNLDDKKYQDNIKYITQLFLMVTNGHKVDNIKQVDIDWFGYPFDGTYTLLTFKNMCNIDTILLLIAKSSALTGVLNVLLSNADAVSNGYFKISNNKIEICTILLIYNPIYKYRTNYKTTIEHELKHAYDILTEYHGSNEQMNRDILKKETEFDPKIEKVVDTKVIYNNEYTIPLSKLQEINDNYTTKYYNDYKITFALLSDMLYYMNKSEVSARLILFKCSEDYEESIYLYNEYDRLCDNIINHASDRVKNFINDIIHSADYESIYHIKFSKGAISNTNKLFKFYKKRINHFIMHCRTLLKESKSYASLFLNLGYAGWVRELEIKEDIN